ncbi:response regulator [Stappia sp. ES.058]|uniref:response regulator n=1 Tax=Stappia sp. ES.058 TaxID=1881061 RepID=UPI00087C3CE4|nr:response regulator [Stappia sp. ES.058]SDU36266.1 Response regulator receiver domain-containing protein [Stappia sp. ES.058]
MQDADSGTRGAAILLVEDDPDDIRIIQKSLETSPVPVRITTAENGADALVALDGLAASGSPPPDLILLDLNLPVMGGTEFLARLRAHAQFSAIPVCVFTTADDPVTIRSAYAAGANAVVTKADSLTGMSEVLHTIVEFWFKVAERYPPD